MLQLQEETSKSDNHYQRQPENSKSSYMTRKVASRAEAKIILETISSRIIIETTRDLGSTLLLLVFLHEEMAVIDVAFGDKLIGNYL